MYNQLLQETNNLQKSSYFRMDVTERLFLQESLLNIFKDINNRQDILSSMRIYINGELLGENDVCKIGLFNQVPETFKGFKKWAKKVFGDNEFLILINKAEIFHDPIASHFSEKFQDINDSIEGSPVHLEGTYFIGNSKYTPFGAHIDEISNAYHYNLSEQERYMFLWDPETYEKERGSLQHLIDPSNILQYAYKYVVEQHHAFFLPAQKYYHVGVNNDFTVSFALALIKYDKPSFVKKVCNVFSEHISKSIDLDSILSGNPPIKDVNLNKYVEKYFLSLLSKGNFRAAPKKIENVVINHKNTLKRIQPFQIQYCANGQKLDLFIRGYHTKLPNNKDIVQLVETINAVDKIKVNEVLCEFENKIGINLTKQLLEFFIKFKLLEVYNE